MTYFENLFLPLNFPLSKNIQWNKIWIFKPMSAATGTAIIKVDPKRFKGNARYTRKHF